MQIQSKKTILNSKTFSLSEVQKQQWEASSSTPPVFFPFPDVFFFIGEKNVHEMKEHLIFLKLGYASEEKVEKNTR